MEKQSINILSKIIEWGLILLAFSLPLFFLPITSEAFEFPKQILLIFSVSILTLIWVIKMILEKAVKILHSPLTTPILIFFGIFFLSTIFSIHRFSSIFGSYPKLQGGLISIFICLLTFFLVASNIQEKKQIIRLLFVLCFSGLLVAIIGVFNFFDFYLLSDFLRGRFITPAGPADGSSLFLILLFPILALTFFFGESLVLRILSALAGFFFLLYIFLISQIAAILSVFLVLLLVLFFARFQLSRPTAIRLGITFLLILFLLAINNVGPIRSQIPFLKDRPAQHDISIDLDTAWAITASSFQSFKLLILGSGPSTYLFDFTSFKPSRFNQTSLWDLRFEKSSNEYLQITSTLGLLGLITFIYLLIVIGRIGKEIWQGKEDLLSWICLSSVILFAFIGFFVPSAALTNWAFWLFLGLFVSSARLINLTGIREVELSVATVQPRGLSQAKEEILPWVVGVITVLILVPLFWQEGRIFQAEIHFAKAQAEQFKEQPNANFILESLREARNIMPNNDTYRRTLSATCLNFAILGQEQLSEDTKQWLLQEAVREGETAARLAPHNIFNWENLQRVYTLVTIERNDELLINNVFPREISLDPINPRHWNDLGWVYFNMRNDIDTAKWHFQRAISLKSDFPDARYNLARVYKEEGKKGRALQEYEQSLNLLNQQINFLEPIVSARPDLQAVFNQLKQSAEQIRREKEELEAVIEMEEVPPTEETKPPTEESPGPAEEETPSP